MGRWIEFILICILGFIVEWLGVYLITNILCTYFGIGNIIGLTFLVWIELIILQIIIVIDRLNK